MGSRVNGKGAREGRGASGGKQLCSSKYSLQKTPQPGAVSRGRSTVHVNLVTQRHIAKLCSNSYACVCVYVNDVLCLLCLILHLYYSCHFRILLL